MSWIRSSKVIALGALLALSLVAVGTAAALTVDGGEPAPAEVGDTVTHQITIQEPFRDQPAQWTLGGQTDLEDASWNVREVSQGDPVNTDSPSGQSFSYDLNEEDAANEVVIEVTGQVPDMSTFNYENLGAENYTAIALSQNDGELQTFTGHRYTTGDGDSAGSQEARQAIDDAIEAAGGENGDIEQAISSYDNGNFDNARSLAEDAQGGAQTMQIVLIAVGVVVVLSLVGGGIYYYRESKKQGTKLQ